MEYKYTITLDTTTQRRKPTKPEIGIIVNNMTLVTGLTLNEMASYFVYPYAYTWSGGLFSKKIKNEYWLEQQVFALDFDLGLITVEEVINKLYLYEIIPNFWYNTLSDSVELNKFRIIICIDQPVECEEHRRIISDGLLEMFPEADKKCRNACRIFLGGKKSNILNNKPNSTNKLIDILSIQLITSDGGRTRKIPASVTHTKSGKKRNYLYNYIGNNKNSQTPKTTTTEGSEQVTIDWNKARTKVKVLNEFLNGVWLYHDQLFGLATNLINIKGGRKLMKETMQKYNELGCTKYTQNNFNIFPYLNKVNYPPIPVYKFSLYKEDEDINDILNATNEVRGHIEVVQPIEKIDLHIAEQIFKTKFNEAISDSDFNKIHLFVLPTAIGKTQMLTDCSATIALPTNKLKEEVAQRMKVDCIITPNPIVFESEYLNKKIQYYYSIGMPKKATAILYEIIKEKNAPFYKLDEIIKAQEYINQITESYNSSKTVLTTHSRALHSNFSHETIIFDEDPMSELLQVKSLQISDLVKLNYSTSIKNKDVENLIQYCVQQIPGELVKTSFLQVEFDELMETVSKSEIAINLFDFLNSKYILRDPRNLDFIHFINKNELPLNKKIIILSATLSIDIYKKLYGDRLNIIDISDVKQQGSITQYTKRSYSRNSLNRNNSDIVNLVGEKPVITFKSFAHLFKNPVEAMHFGNCEGYDSISGKDLVVVGTPHRNNIEYFLIAKVLGIDFNSIDAKAEYLKIEYKGFKFMFNCFKNEELRNIQLALIESDLVQAVGRARTLRTDAKVELYSNFPLRITSNFIY